MRLVDSTRIDSDRLVCDFSLIGRDLEEDSANMWELYTKVCYAIDPPVPALSLMRPILFGDQNSAFFAHQMSQSSPNHH
jgi:hypothetical protein